MTRREVDLLKIILSFSFQAQLNDYASHVELSPSRQPKHSRDRSYMGTLPRTHGDMPRSHSKTAFVTPLVRSTSSASSPRSQFFSSPPSSVHSPMYSPLDHPLDAPFYGSDSFSTMSLSRGKPPQKRTVKEATLQRDSMLRASGGMRGSMSSRNGYLT